MKKIKPLFWVAGNYYECQKCWRDICSKLKDPKITVLECGRNAVDTPVDERLATVGTVIKLLKRQDIFDKRPRVLKLKGIPEDYALLIDYFPLIKGTNALVIDGPIGIRAKPPSQKWTSVKTSKFFKAIKAKGQVKEYATEGKNQSQATIWIKEVAKELGRTLNGDAARLLVDMKGLNYDILYGAFGLMSDYQPKGTIKEDVVKELFTPTFQKTVWDLVEAIDRGNFVGSMDHLQKFYNQGAILADSVFVGEVEMLLGALAHHFTFLLMARDGCNGLITYNSVAKAVEGMKKSGPQTKDEKRKGIWKEPFVAAYSPGLIKMNLNSPALKWRASRLYNAQKAISLCRLSVRKTYNYGNRPGLKLCLDTLIMMLCGQIKVRHAEMLLGAGEEMGIAE